MSRLPHALTGWLLTMTVLFTSAAWAEAPQFMTDKKSRAVLDNSYASYNGTRMRCGDVLNLSFTNIPNIFRDPKTNDLVIVPGDIFDQCMDIFVKLFPRDVKRAKQMGIDLEGR